MENLTLEEKIASFRQKIEDLGETATTAPNAGGPAFTPEALAAEFETGKIAAMKNRLIRMGLSVDKGGAASADSDGSPGKGAAESAAAAAAAAAATADKDDENTQVVAVGPSEEEKAAKLAAEFEKGKIAAMKNRLVSMGLGIDAAADAAAAAQALAAAKAAHAAAKAAALASAEEAAAAASAVEGGDSEVLAEEHELESPQNDAEMSAAEDDLMEDSTERSASATIVDGNEVDGSDAVTCIAVEKDMEVSPKSILPDRDGDYSPNITGEKGDVVGSDNMIIAPSSDEEELHASIPPSASPHRDEQTAGVFASENIVAADEDAPVANGNRKKETATPMTGPAVAAAAATENGSHNALSSTPVAPPDTPPTAATTADAEDAAPTPSNGNAPSSQATVPVADTAAEPATAARTSSSAAPKKDESDASASASNPSPNVQGFNVAASKAKAALAAAKARADQASVGAMLQKQQQQQQRRRRVSTPDRKLAGEKRVSSPSPAGAGIGMTRKSPSPSMPVRGRRRSDANGGLAARSGSISTPIAKRRPSPSASQVSRATPTTPVTPGLIASPGAASAAAPAPAVSEPPAQRPHHRSSTPTRKRQSSPQQRQQKQPQLQVVTPARFVPSSGIVLTPASAELSGNRLHEQAREARERLERRRQNGVSPPLVMPGLIPYAPSLVVTPGSAERSGHRLHEQARQARERLERRRAEGANPTSPFTPRRFTNPKMGSPSLAGMERLENLYRDAVQRHAKLEMIRKAEDDNPRDCTFTPEIGRRASSRGRGETREPRTGSDGDDGEGRTRRRRRSSSNTSSRDIALRFNALYDDAKRRRDKMDAIVLALAQQSARSGSPAITARGRQASLEPFDVRAKENAERWTRRWQELEEKKLAQEKKGCTFMPDFSVGRSASAPRLRPRRSSSGVIGGSRSGGGDRSSISPVGIESFMARSAKFQATREQNIEKLKQQLEQRERLEETFRPKILDRASDADLVRMIGGGGEGNDVFARLLRAANNQEVNKAALVEAFLKKEHEDFHGFQVDGPASVPLDARIRKSTEDWVRNRALREQRRRELDAEQCTFHPALGRASVGASGSGGGGHGSIGGGRRSSSVDPRARQAASRRSPARGGKGMSPAASAAFAARNSAFQEARNKRLKKLREEQKQLEIQEATSQPVIGVNGRGSGGVGGADIPVANGAAEPAGAQLNFEERNDQDVAYRRGREVELNRERVRRETEECTLDPKTNTDHQHQPASAQKRERLPIPPAAIHSKVMPSSDAGVFPLFPAAQPRKPDGHASQWVPPTSPPPPPPPGKDAADAGNGDSAPLTPAIASGVDVEELSARLQELAEASDFSDSQEGANDYGMPIVAAYSEANGGETEEDEEDDEALQIPMEVERRVERSVLRGEADVQREDHEEELGQEQEQEQEQEQNSHKDELELKLDAGEDDVREEDLPGKRGGAADDRAAFTTTDAPENEDVAYADSGNSNGVVISDDLIAGARDYEEGQKEEVEENDQDVKALTDGLLALEIDGQEREAQNDAGNKEQEKEEDEEAKEEEELLWEGDDVAADEHPQASIDGGNPGKAPLGSMLSSGADDSAAEEAFTYGGSDVEEDVEDYLVQETKPESDEHGKQDQDEEEEEEDVDVGVDDEVNMDTDIDVDVAVDDGDGDGEQDEREEDAEESMHQHARTHEHVDQDAEENADEDEDVEVEADDTEEEQEEREDVGVDVGVGLEDEEEDLLEEEEEEEGGAEGEDGVLLADAYAESDESENEEGYSFTNTAYTGPAAHSQVEQPPQQQQQQEEQYDDLDAEIFAADTEDEMRDEEDDDEEENEGEDEVEDKLEDEDEVEDELEDEGEDESEDEDEEEYSYTNTAYNGRGAEASSQTSRSLADFDRAQREIEAKLRAL